MDAIPKAKDGLIDWSQVSQIHIQVCESFMYSKNKAADLGALLLELLYVGDRYVRN